MTIFDDLVVRVGITSHGLAAAAFLVLAVLFVLSWGRGRLGAWLVAACATTAAWAAVVAYGLSGGGGVAAAARALEVARSGAWIAFLLVVLAGTWDRLRPGVVHRLALPLAGAVAVTLAALDIAEVGAGRKLVVLVGADVPLLGRLALAIVGLLLVENLFRNTGREQMWSVKYLGFGLGGLFAYDFFLYADALLFQHVDFDLFDARGFVNALIVPLIAVSAARNPAWTVNVAVSRRVVFHSATLVAAGGYLILMAGAGYYVRQFGGQWGSVLQVLFLFAAMIVLLVVVTSGSVRAWLRVKISKHFFSYKYDYRHEWLRLIATISAVGVPGGLPVRVIQGVADILDCPDGVLWLRQDGDRFAPAANWNLPLPDRIEALDAPSIAFLERTQWIIDLDEYRANRSAYGDLVLPDGLLSINRGWLIVPLPHHDRLIGLLLIGRPRSPKELNWEDFDLLKTVGRQAASYLAEQQSAQALAEARQFAEFNRRFAFVVHDIKNLVSQLSLMVANAEKHKHNAAFQEDMLQTVAESVAKMNNLLVRLHQGGKQASPGAAVRMAPLLRRVAERNARGGCALAFECRDEDAAVVIDEERFAAVLAHLVDNAVEAAGAAGRVTVRQRREAGELVIEIEDDGPGMDAEFVRHKLFAPFASTKSGGYGIGAYESRELVHEMGGRLDVFSRPGEGTLVRIALPAVAAPDADASLRRMAAS